MDPDSLRSEILDRWEHAAAGWGKHADRMRQFGMPVSSWMIEQAGLQPGQRVLELAAGPGDTGFLAAELIRPGGMLLSTDGTENMLEVARARANELGIGNVEFRRIELEWIDLDTASVDAVLCKWGLMFSLDPETALREARRVLRPGGRIALAAWDEPEANAWATIPTQALVELGHTEPPDPDAPGMFILSAPGRLQDLLESAGFVDVVVDSVPTHRSFASVEHYLAETREISSFFG
ncbi:MAG TPA: methyltransferase domain-containing protein, partial [Solirubrobacteraceae bacterium]|nr:methyltransferase domain-containing protein [Solirubrobacteraceae bacterium]